MSVPLAESYFVLFFCFSLVLGFRLLGRSRLERIFACAALAGNGLLLSAIWALSGHLPVFNLFESFLLHRIYPGSTDLGLHSKKAPDRFCTRTWIWAEVILLFGILLFYPETHAPQRYYNMDLSVVLFHVGRAVALAVMLLASGFYADFLWTSRRSSSQEDPLHMGRNFLVLGTILFRISEYAGMLLVSQWLG